MENVSIFNYYKSQVVHRISIMSKTLRILRKPKQQSNRLLWVEHLPLSLPEKTPGGHPGETNHFPINHTQGLHPGCGDPGYSLNLRG